MQAISICVAENTEQLTSYIYYAYTIASSVRVHISRDGLASRACSSILVAAKLQDTPELCDHTQGGTRQTQDGDGKDDAPRWRSCADDLAAAAAVWAVDVRRQVPCPRRRWL